MVPSLSCRHQRARGLRDMPRRHHGLRQSLSCHELRCETKGIFDITRNPATLREPIEAAVVAGKHVTVPHEAWIGCDPFHSGVRLLITRRHGFERTVTFAVDQVPAAIT